MRLNTTATIATGAVIALLVALTFIVPRIGAPQPVAADGDTPADEIRLFGAIRDFRRTHVDFETTPDGGWGHYAGNVLPDLGSNGRPIFAGFGPAAPDGPLDVLLVARSQGAPTSEDSARRDVLESWGYVVTTIYDDEPQADFDAAICKNDVVYVSEQACWLDVAGKLRNATIGVVSENRNLSDPEFGFAQDAADRTDNDIFITDRDHPITDGLAGRVVIADAPIPLHRTDGAVAPGGRDLARLQGGGAGDDDDDDVRANGTVGSAGRQPALMIIETGDALYGGGVAAGRRVRLPWGQLQMEGGLGDGDDDGDDGDGDDGDGDGDWDDDGDDGMEEDDDDGSAMPMGVCAFAGDWAGDDDDGDDGDGDDGDDDDDDDDADGDGGLFASMHFDALNGTGLQVLKRSLLWAAGFDFDSGGTANGYRVQAPWYDGDGHPIAPHLYADPAAGTALDDCGAAISDVAGVAGNHSSGGIESAGSFAQWYTDVLGLNISTAYAITLVRGGDGVYRFSESNFHPIDGQLYGNEGHTHNDYYTWTISADFVFDACADYFFEWEGNDDVWVFINGRLAIDAGGPGVITRQRVALDRLGLVDGETYTLAFFHAHRQSTPACVSIETNIQFLGSNSPMMTNTYD